MHFSWIRHWFVCTEIQCLEYFRSLWCFLRHPWTPNQWSRPCLAVSSNLTRSWWTSGIATIQALVIRIYTHHTHNTQHTERSFEHPSFFVVSMWSRNQFLNTLTLCKQCVISCYYRLIVMNIILYSFHNLKTYFKKTQNTIIKNSCRTFCVLPYGGLCPGGSPWQRPPPNRDPTRQRPPGQRSPQAETLWTETSLDRDPLDRDPLTETPWTETSLDRDPPRQRPPSHQTCGACWDRDPPCEQNDWLTGVKTLPCRNFVCGW